MPGVALAALVVVAEVPADEEGVDVVLDVGAAAGVEVALDDGAVVGAGAAVLVLGGGCVEELEGCVPEPASGSTYC